MIYKSARMLVQYEALPDLLQEMADEFEKISLDNKIKAVVTRVSDPVEGESGVHPQHRAIDFRNQYFDGKVNRWLYPTELVEEILNHINTLYPRDDGRQTLIHHSFRGGMFHFHLQMQFKDLTAKDTARIAAYEQNLKENKDA